MRERDAPQRDARRYIGECRRHSASNTGSQPPATVRLLKEAHQYLGVSLWKISGPVQKRLSARANREPKGVCCYLSPMLPCSHDLLLVPLCDEENSRSQICCSTKQTQAFQTFGECVPDCPHTNSTINEQKLKHFMGGPPSLQSSWKATPHTPLQLPTKATKLDCSTQFCVTDI